MIRPPGLSAGDARAARRLAALIPYAYRSPFWAPRLRAAGLPAVPSAAEAVAGLRRLEPVSKRELRLAGADAVLDGRLRPWWPSSLSSGSTGEPFRLHFDLRAWVLLKYSVKLRARLACGLKPWHRVAVLDAVPVAHELALPSLLRPRFQRLSVLRPPEELADRLAAQGPQVLYGLPSALLEAALAAERRGRRLGPRLVFTSGELLQPATRAALARAYGARVLEVYGSSETKEIAWECRSGGMHLNADVLVVEVLDRAGSPVPPGEEGDITVTVLVNRAMPLLRYRVGDRGRLATEPCRCGSELPVLRVVSGRESDTLELGDGRRVSPYAVTSALERVPGILQYQVSQLERRRLRVRAIASASAERPRVGEAIRAALRSGVEESLEVEVEFVEQLRRGSQAKLRTVEPLAGGTPAPESRA